MRTLAIGDIHGCLAAFDTLLQVVRPAADDLLVTLGDHVDRGPDSRGVIERLLQLHSGGRTVSLKGNHEVMMLAARGGRGALRTWLTHGGSEALESYRERGKHVSLDDVPDRHWKFIGETCRPYFETETHIFVHAELDPDAELPDQSDERLFWGFFDPRRHRPHRSGKTVVCGHSSQKGGLPLVLERAICIDTWACGDGWLTCLDVLGGTYWQADELGRTRAGTL